MFRTQLADKPIKNPNALPIGLIPVGRFCGTAFRNFGANLDAVNKRRQLFTIQRVHICILPDELIELIVALLNAIRNLHRAGFLEKLG